MCCCTLSYAIMFLISSIVNFCINNSIQQRQIYQSAYVLTSLQLRNKVSINQSINNSLSPFSGSSCQVA